MEQLGHTPLPSERPVVRGVAAAVRSEEAFEVAAFQDVVFVPAPVEEIRPDPLRRERPREKHEGSETDPAGDERDAVRGLKVVDRERHSQGTEDGKRRPFGEARERGRSDSHDLDDELHRGHARELRDVGDGERAPEVRAQALAGLDHGEMTRFRPRADRAGREEQGIVLVVVVDRLEDAERFVDGHQEGGETRRARIMSEGRPAYHLPLAGALAGLAAGDLLLGLNPELSDALSAARLLLVAASSGACLALPVLLLPRARRASRTGTAWSACALAVFGLFVEFQRQALHEFVPAGGRRVLVATAVAAFLSAGALAAGAGSGGGTVRALSIPIVLFLLPPLAFRHAPERRSEVAPPDILRAPRRNLLVVGLEGASWGLLTTYASEGAMPVIARLLREGAAGPLAALAPYDRAALWTTAATGKKPLKHGVVSSRRWRTPAGSLRLLPVLPGSPVPGGERSGIDASVGRRSLTFWEILASRGHEAAVLDWPASSPAREGLVLWASDAFFDGEAGAAAARPREAAARARLFRVAPSGLDRPLARSLVPRGVEGDEARLDPLRGAARDLTVAGAALAALPQGPLNVSALVLSGLSEAGALSGAAENARYWGFSFPEKEAEARAAALRAYYRFLDDLLGEILEREGKERTICLFAPVGWGPPPTLEAISLFLRGQRPVASPDAARDGFVLFAGAGVRSGVRLTSANVLDLAPTLLVLAGEPLARDMDGRVLAEVFDERFTESESVPIVSTFEESGPQ